MLLLLFLLLDFSVSFEEAIITSSPFISTLPASTLAPSYITFSPASTLCVPPTSNLEFTFTVPSLFPFPLLWEAVTLPNISFGLVETVKSAFRPLEDELLDDEYSSLLDFTTTSLDADRFKSFSVFISVPSIITLPAPELIFISPLDSSLFFTVDSLEEWYSDLLLFTPALTVI